jgi:hypothetical protein
MFIFELENLICRAWGLSRYTQGSKYEFPVAAGYFHSWASASRKLTPASAFQYPKF